MGLLDGAGDGLDFQAPESASLANRGPWVVSHRIDTLEVLRGRLPQRALALVLEWSALHRAELAADWDRARQRVPLAGIPPLD